MCCLCDDCICRPPVPSVFRLAAAYEFDRYTLDTQYPERGAPSGKALSGMELLLPYARDAWMAMWGDDVRVRFFCFIL